MYALQQRSQVHFPVDGWHSYTRVLTAYRLLSFEPTYTTLPSVLRVGEESTQDPVAKDHFLVPSAVFTAYRLVSSEPTYTTLPSVLRVGEDSTSPPVAKDHFLVRPAAVTLRPDVES